MEVKMFLLLEGIDASGKSEVAQKVADKLGGVVYNTPPEKYRKLRKEVDSGGDIQKHYEFYREAVTFASEEIREMINSGQVVVCVRYWPTTVVYHMAGGMTPQVADFSSLLQPDFTALLVVSSETQVKRSNGRIDEIGNIHGKQGELTNLYLRILLESGLPFMALATDSIGADEVSDILISAFLVHKKSPTQ